MRDHLALCCWRSMPKPGVPPQKTRENRGRTPMPPLPPHSLDVWKRLDILAASFSVLPGIHRASSNSHKFCNPAVQRKILGRIRGTPQKGTPSEPPLLALLSRDLIQRVHIPKGPPYPIPYKRQDKAHQVPFRSILSFRSEGFPVANGPASRDRNPTLRLLGTTADRSLNPKP